MGQLDELRTLHEECVRLLQTRQDTEKAIGRNISRQLDIINSDPHVLDGIEDASEIKRTLGRAIAP